MSHKLKEYMNVEVRTDNKESNIHIWLKALIDPSFNAVYLIRKMQLANTKIIRYIYRRKLAIKYGVYIGENTKIGIGLRMQHPTSIIIGNHVVIGKNCTIFQNVTLGINKIASGGGILQSEITRLFMQVQRL